MRCQLTTYLLLTMKTQPANLATEERLADTDITAAVERLLQLKKGIYPQFIKVACNEGISELTGFTDSLLLWERAAEITKVVRGVRAVINEINIRTADVPDGELKHRVELVLQQTPVVSEYNIRCHTRGGEVTVKDTLQSWAEEQLALKAISAVPGVRHLTNRLHICDGELLNSDEEITAQIQSFLAWDFRVKSNLVKIRTEYGKAYTATERDMLGYDPKVRFFDPSVHVRDEVVVLACTVSNLKACLAAEQDAGNVLGVWDVHNLLQVQVPNPAPDGLIHQQAKLALVIDPYVGHYPFTMSVSNGWVQLYGSVATHFDQEYAVDVVAGINGVAGAGQPRAGIRSRRAVYHCIRGWVFWALHAQQHRARQVASATHPEPFLLVGTATLPGYQHQRARWPRHAHGHRGYLAGAPGCRRRRFRLWCP